MAAYQDSIDVTQLRNFALEPDEIEDQDHDLLPATVASETRIPNKQRQVDQSTRTTGTEKSALQQSQNRSSAPWPASVHGPSTSSIRASKPRPAFPPELPSTIPDSLVKRMLGTDSQSEGDTQPISPSVYELYNTRSKEQQAGGISQSVFEEQESVPHTLQPGEPGHIDLLAAFEQTSPGDGDDPRDDDIDPLSQPQDIRADIFPESRRFQPPKTPASQGTKRKRLLEPSSEGLPTPKLPVNPFAGQIGALNGVMSASQLFKATQAATSPLSNIIASDGLSERPSPDTADQERPATAAPMSSPIQQFRRSNMARAVTEPQAVYISMKQSQEERERLLQAMKAEQARSHDEMSDEDFDDDPQLRRRLRQKRYSLEAKNQFDAVAKCSEEAGSRDRRRYGSNAIVRSSPRRVGIDREPVVISDDAPMEAGQGSITEDETDREEDAKVVEDDDVDELAEDNKENIEVPATVSRTRLRPSPAVSTQSSPSRRQVTRAKVSSPAKKAVQVPGSSQISRSQDVPRPDETGTQTDAIADSQASQTYVSNKLHSTRSATRAFSEPRSSLDSRVLVPQSQSSETSKDNRRLAKKPDLQHSAKNPARAILQDSSPAGEEDSESHGPTAQVKTPSTGAVMDQGQLESSNDGMLRRATTPDRQVKTTRSTQHSVQENLTSNETAKPKSGYSESRINTIPDSSNTIPSFRKIPKSVSKAVSSHSIPSASHASTAFETAPERPANSPSSYSPQRRLQRSQSLQPSPEKSRLIRTMSQIAADPSPPNFLGEIDVDLNLLSNEDREFQRTLHASSPTAPSTKRRRGGLGAVLVDQQSARNPLPQMPCSPLPPPSSAVSAITPAKITPSKITPISSSPPQLNVATVKDKGDDPLGRRNLPQVASRGELVSGQVSAAEAGTIVGASSSIMTGPGAQISASGHDNLPTQANQEAATGRGLPHEPSVIASNRVLAHFNGSVAAYHPATCLEVIQGGDIRYRVRFDDGTVDTISAYGIKRLELRKGDVIKVDLPGSRTKNFCVDGMTDPQRPATPPDPATPSRRGRKHSTNNPAFPETDIHGFATVLATPKLRAPSDAADNSQVAIPITQIYITQTLWTSFRDRQYVHASNRLQTLTGLQTPSERPSTPSTPSSRTRRLKALGLAHAKMSSAIKEGIFKNMTFAITHVDRAEESKRVKENILSNGGIVLEDGFDELFSIPTLRRTTDPHNTSDVSFELTPEAQGTGFACLIADKHCRRAKFIQALALGIPCLATRWISDCIAKQRVLPWAAYLLPAGESTFLGGAVRSRDLQPSPAESTPLSDMVVRRPQLLEGDSVLLIMEKNQETTMKQHPLITHALGASKVQRAVSMDAAAKAVSDAHALGDPWDWVFSYDKEKEVEKRLNGGGSTGKKRKRGRQSDGASVSGNKMKTKVVGNEFVIQSLILGMLVDE